MSRALISFVATTLLFTSIPFVAFAFPFGGQISIFRPCFNQAIYALIGPPRGGPYIWTPSTLTYQFGPPSHPGQSILGLAGIPYYCLVSVQPIEVWPGIYIMMMGSSQ
ncbi:hypothetical protein COU18_00335 [Candidatus Kaiserbacteria bacterium CG10_big_fil_rev_8_21_14_0_10_51_14]|uniref:Uncharacterized protein n=1 Tax=Candidatus Kaiserbacteria bacterium CG10_big_fil_rev_8_21_14_0_10_51_14 TaxID=1974610 RepID=A0A2H0UCQ1_9BACT|nr:MAG: hypothetical protein COU18_00335 [Candidatus Kaiserbacteria bacterium CG10_big_fil_rev_8_21_14_0_10_51_14]